VRYEWDERKNRENRRKHNGISFELATLVFRDERRLLSLDRVDDAGEQRWHAIGAVSVAPGVGDVMVVVHVYRHPSGEDLPPGTPREDSHGEEIVRIISARWASNDEYRRYQEQEMD
jgi:uncharacterized DUF497 family protein